MISPYAIPGIVRQSVVDVVKSIVADHYNMKAWNLDVNDRARVIVQARQMAHYFSKQHSKYSLTEIGRQIGNKDHATVLHSIKTINNLQEVDANIRSDVEKINAKIIKQLKTNPYQYATNN